MDSKLQKTNIRSEAKLRKTCEHKSKLKIDQTYQHINMAPPATRKVMPGMPLQDNHLQPQTITESCICTAEENRRQQ